MDEKKFAKYPQVKSSLVLTGSLKESIAGSPVGLVDFDETEAAYIFQVALPGVSKDHPNVSCEIERDGRVHIEGVVTGHPGNSSTMPETKVKPISPAGPFTISFTLPGPVDPRLFSPSFRRDGLLKVVVMKFKTPPRPREGGFAP
ncbi:hypothetical protein UlMin_033885 [Ulmus minor]